MVRQCPLEELAWGNIYRVLVFVRLVAMGQYEERLERRGSVSTHSPFTRSFSSQYALRWMSSML